MPGVTVSGSAGGLPVDITASGALQASMAQRILFATAASPTGVQSGSGTSSKPDTSNVATSGSVITGPVSVGSASLLLAGQFQTYLTGGTVVSTVVAADYSNSSVVNTGATNGLIAVTGAGGNVLSGWAGINQFATSSDGHDVVTLNGSSNTLVSEGSDTVLVGGPSTITAAGSGADSVRMSPAATLSFINGSIGPTDSVTGAVNAAIAVAGPGSTSVSSGVGPESFFVDTSAGSVTLNNHGQSGNTFEFVKDTDVGTATVTVSAFAAGDNVLVHGYGGFSVTASPTDPSASVLLLSDGSRVTFSNLSATTLGAAVRTV